MCILHGFDSREMTQVYSQSTAYALTPSAVAAVTTPGDEAAAFPHAALGSASSRNGLMESRNELR
jgi:hypothetical protein